MQPSAERHQPPKLVFSGSNKTESNETMQYESNENVADQDKQETKVSRDGDKEWTPADDVGELDIVVRKLDRPLRPRGVLAE
jgi:hypothetical protein